MSIIITQVKSMASKWFGNLEVTPKDIETWHAKESNFCSGCIDDEN